MSIEAVTNLITQLWNLSQGNYLPSANRLNTKIWDASATLIMRTPPHEPHPSTDKCNGVVCLGGPSSFLQ